ncbi:MAG: hypothetical protein WCT26_03065 [Candidatus Buchananbacteria bacterium]|jgi:hypothetical protein
MKSETNISGEDRINVVIENRIGGRYFTTVTRQRLAEMEKEAAENLTGQQIVASGMTDTEATQICQRALTPEVMEQHIEERPTDALKLMAAKYE